MIVWERGAGGAGIVPESISCQVDLYPAVFVQDTTLRYGFPYRFFKGTVRGFMWGGVPRISGQDYGLLGFSLSDSVAATIDFIVSRIGPIAPFMLLCL